jgi:hypothetical protein
VLSFAAIGAQLLYAAPSHVVCGKAANDKCLWRLQGVEDQRLVRLNVDGTGSARDVVDEGAGPVGGVFCQ